MTIAETLLPEFDQEMITTRRLLERVPKPDLDLAVAPRYSHETTEKLRGRHPIQQMLNH